MSLPTSIAQTPADSSAVDTSNQSMPKEPGAIVAELLSAASIRAQTERTTDKNKETALRQAQATHEKELSLLQSQINEKLSAIEQEFHSGSAAIEAQIKRARVDIESNVTSTTGKIKNALFSEINQIEKHRDETIWHASTKSDTQKTNIESEFNALRRQKNGMASRLDAMAEAWDKLGIVWPEAEDEDKDEGEQGRNQETHIPTIGEKPIAPDLSLVETKVTELEKLGHKISRFWLRKLFSIPMIAVWAIATAGLATVIPANPVQGVIAGALLGLIGHFVSRFLFKKLLSKAMHEWMLVDQALSPLDNSIQAWREASLGFINSTLDETKDQATSETKRLTMLKQMEADDQLKKLHQESQLKLTEIQAHHDSEQKKLSENLGIRKSALEKMRAEDEARILNQLKANQDSALKAYESAWTQIRNQWNEQSSLTEKNLDQWRTKRNTFAPDWNNLQLNRIWSEPAGALFLGQARIPLESVNDLISTDAQIRQYMPNLVDIPVHVQLPGPRSTVWIQAPPGRRGEMSSLLQTIALRALSAFPPGQLRFTLIDPVALGQTFAGLLHLGDFEPALVNQRPWTESRDIEARLAELTAHLEFVVQNYLRNQYATIEDYNRDAGEVAEAYRFVIIADWPNGISDESARRLRRLIEAGSRCGIYVVLGHDLSTPGPVDPAQAELRQHIHRIVWSADKGRWSIPGNPIDAFEIHWDTPPDPETATRIVRTLGQQASKALRVEVPFSAVAPAPDHIWKESTARGIEIPLGRAGARKIQSLKLGEGTSQHVLLAGRTGSGKSTLLHAIVTNAALRFSPDELQLYLVDFKKGVEFKNYATRNLPHAQVVAVESEREFGLSVLERLDRELTMRGELFRQAGVQDVAGFRRRQPDTPMPRILLVVDEFQELFNEDDRLASDAASLMDRLVRQGRAFGIHAIFGSQSLAGAYALARSTLGQMGVRIALQCNENDSRMILSEDNPAARQLSRPGEAIYNDANGLVEGNHLFQAVWIADEDRETQLALIHAEALRRHWQRAEPMIVFEGRSPGDISRNKALQEKLSLPESQRDSIKPTTPPWMWLGESVTISPPPSIAFERMPGSNVLIVGRQGQEIRPMLAAGLLGITATNPKARVTIIESPVAGETGLQEIAEGLGDTCLFVKPSSLKAEITNLWEKLRARQYDGSLALEPLILMINDLARLRDLRKSDDDYGFSGFGSGTTAPPSITKMFGEILRDGPAVGVHTLLWTDGSITLDHATERSARNEFGTVVIFQSTANESTHFLDNTAASRLEKNQALIVRPSEGETIKIRPYGRIPQDLWQRWTKQLKA